MIRRAAVVVKLQAQESAQRRTKRKNSYRDGVTMPKWGGGPPHIYASQVKCPWELDLSMQDDGSKAFLVLERM